MNIFKKFTGCVYNYTESADGYKNVFKQIFIKQTQGNSTSKLEENVYYFYFYTYNEIYVEKGQRLHK